MHNQQTSIHRRSADAEGGHQIIRAQVAQTERSLQSDHLRPNGPEGTDQEPLIRRESPEPRRKSPKASTRASQVEIRYQQSGPQGRREERLPKFRI